MRQTSLSEVNDICAQTDFLLEVENRDHGNRCSLCTCTRTAYIYHCCQVLFAETDGFSLFDGSWGRCSYWLPSLRMLHTHQLRTFPDFWTCTFYETCLKQLIILAFRSVLDMFCFLNNWQLLAWGSFSKMPFCGISICLQKSDFHFLIIW